MKGQVVYIPGHLVARMHPDPEERKTQVQLALEAFLTPVRQEAKPELVHKRRRADSST